MHRSRIRKELTASKGTGIVPVPSDAIRERVRLERTEEGKVRYRIEATQDSEALLKSAERFRHREQALAKNPDAQMHHYARLSSLQVLELREKHKLDILKPMSTSERKRLHYIIETEFSRLKTTDKRVFKRRA